MAAFNCGLSTHKPAKPPAGLPTLAAYSTGSVHGKPSLMSYARLAKSYISRTTTRFVTGYPGSSIIGHRDPGGVYHDDFAFPLVPTNLFHSSAFFFTLPALLFTESSLSSI